jgi:O-antigen/teichoic acid export membrane protein
MSYTRKIAHNTIIQILGKTISTIIGVIVIGMLTRYLGEAGFGQYAIIMAFLQFFGVLVDMGLYIILVKKISEPDVDQDSLVSNIFTLRLISAVIFLGLAPIVVLFFPYPAIIKWGVLITSLSYLGITLNQVLTGIFQKSLRMDKVAIAEVIGRIILIISTFFVIRANLGLLWVMGSVVAGSLVNFFITFLFSRQFVKIKLHFDFQVWKNIIKETWPIALSIAFNLVYFKADTIILSLYKRAEDVGVYGASYKVLEVLTTFPAMFAGLVLPLLASAWAAQDMERFKRALRKGFDFMAMVAIPLAIGTLFIAKPVMSLVAPEFTNSDRILQLLIFATGIIFIGNLFGNAVVAINKQKTMMWLYLIVAIVSLTGYLIFIPKYSYFGAAWMTIASEFMVTTLAGLIVCLTAKIWPSFRLFGKALISAGVMALVLHFMAGSNLFLLIAIAALVYFVVLYLLKGITKEMLLEVLRIKE